MFPGSITDRRFAVHSKVPVVDENKDRYVFRLTMQCNQSCRMAEGDDDKDDIARSPTKMRSEKRSLAQRKGKDSQPADPERCRAFLQVCLVLTAQLTEDRVHTRAG